MTIWAPLEHARLLVRYSCVAGTGKTGRVVDLLLLSTL